MDRSDIKILKEFIHDNRDLNSEQLKLYFKYFLKVYLDCSLSFGLFHGVTRDLVRLFYDIVRIQKEEKLIDRFLLKNGRIINMDSAIALLDLLEKLNVKTVSYYYSCLEDIETACDLKNEIYAKHRKKDFESLIEVDRYKVIAASMLMNFDDIKNILDYPYDFWFFISDKISFLDYYLYDKDIMCKVNLSDFEDISNFEVILPYIVDYETFKISIMQISQVYSLYCLKMNKSDIIVVSDDCIDQYILKKFYKRKEEINDYNKLGK